VPSTHTSDHAAACGDFPPPCSRRTRGGEREMPLGPPMASCSPVGGGGRLFPATPEIVSTGEMVKMPARMPAHSGASTPSCGGREAIGTGVSRRPEANRRIASFLYYSYRSKGNSTMKPSTATCGTILSLFQAGKQRDGNAASPPLSVGDSRYSAAEPKARRPLDPVLPPTREKKRKKGYCLVWAMLKSIASNAILDL
jgi:hypothetical protein